MTASIKTFALLLVIIIHGFSLHAQNKSLSAAQIEKVKSGAGGRTSNIGGVITTAAAFYYGASSSQILSDKQPYLVQTQGVKR